MGAGANAPAPIQTDDKAYKRKNPYEYQVTRRDFCLHRQLRSQTAVTYVNAPKTCEASFGSTAPYANCGAGWSRLPGERRDCYYVSSLICNLASLSCRLSHSLAKP